MARIKGKTLLKYFSNKDLLITDQLHSKLSNHVISFFKITNKKLQTEL